MSHTNLLIISSDQHNQRFLGCYGHEMVQTPNLDRLAAMGTRFSNAYTPSPICMPARAAMATGRYIHKTANWDNGTPYQGSEADSWGHRLQAQGHQAITFGKLHYHPRGNSGFDERLPLHAKLAEDGYDGALNSWLGKDIPQLGGLRRELLAADKGEFGYTRYDRQIAQEASAWLRDTKETEKPWCAFVSFTYPHYPFLAPAEFVNLYDPDTVPLPVDWQARDWSDHPVLRWKRERTLLDTPLTEAEIRRVTAIYFGMISFMDAQVGIVLDALAASPHAKKTRILYVSDHGDALGEHGMWFKGTMYEGSAGIPMILAGEGVPAGHTCHTPVNLVDLFPTVIESVGADYHSNDEALDGENLVAIANQSDRDRSVISEYHAVVTPTSMYMLRTRRWKYIEYTGYQPQLFDMLADHDESNDLATDPAYADVAADCAAELRRFLSPDETSQRVEAFQSAQVERLGGVEAILSNWPQGRPFTPAPDAFN